MKDKIYICIMNIRLYVNTGKILFLANQTKSTNINEYNIKNKLIKEVTNSWKDLNYYTQEFETQDAVYI